MLVWWPPRDRSLGAKRSTGRRINGPFEYPSVSWLDLLVVILVNTRLFEPMSFIERLSSRVGYLNVKVYAVDLRGLRLSDRVQ